MGDSATAHTAATGFDEPCRPSRYGAPYEGRPANVSAMMGTRAIVLAQLTSGTRATVLGTVAGANPVIAKRLGQLGFRAKARVDVVRRAPLGDPTIYRVHDTELCLRRREAQLIEVVPEADL